VILCRKVGEDISGVEEEVHKRTGISGAELEQKNEDGSQCIKLCNRWYAIYGV